MKEQIARLIIDIINRNAEEYKFEIVRKIASNYTLVEIEESATRLMCDKIVNDAGATIKDFGPSVGARFDLLLMAKVLGEKDYLTPGDLYELVYKALGKKKADPQFMFQVNTYLYSIKLKSLQELEMNCSDYANKISQINPEKPLYEGDILYCKHCGKKLQKSSKCDSCGGHTFNFKKFAKPMIYIAVATLVVSGISIFAIVHEQQNIYTGTRYTYCYVGSVNSNKYHVSGCDYAKKISPSNRIYFFSDEEARAEGYEPCASCKPTGKIRYSK